MNREHFKTLIREGELKELFIEHLGWDSADGDFGLPVTFAGEIHSCKFQRIAAKRGFVVCVMEDGSAFSSKGWRKKVQHTLSLLHYENLLIFLDGKGGQIWSAAIKHPDKPPRTAEITFASGTEPELLLEKLNGIIFTLSDEDGLQIGDVVGRVQDSFARNSTNVTKKFYDTFRCELKKFRSFIRGLQQQADREQYAALMLNRLMFIYFIQGKGFLNGEVRYLRKRFREHADARKAQGESAASFYKSFYRHFLMTLFHSGLGRPAESRSASVAEQIGRVPYLNGGLFDVHELERQYDDDLDIADEAFERIFSFFDKYRWHLDDRETASGRDINPDVIGYIFEKYINERAELGAYYTREDITGYMARNTILPHLLRQVRAQCREAFDAQTGTIWKQLRNNPDRYIHDAVRKGGALPDAALPEHIRIGLDTDQPDLLKRRARWNTSAPEEWALPTETWREALTRRTRYLALKKKIAAGEISDIADLTTHNLDIEKLTWDALKQHEGSDFISAFYTALAGRAPRENSNAGEKRGISVLDPACGSGAFLFAALNVLKPLYQTCIERMQTFVEEDDLLNEAENLRGGGGNLSHADGRRGKRRRHEEFRIILNEIEEYSSEEYWINRSIILKNLFGVDIMPEAVEVAKLRLFLKLAGVAEKDDSKPNMGLEPLPDIDFNIRAGNALVGFASSDDFREKVARELELVGGVDEIHRQIKVIGTAYRRFVDMQTVSNINTSEFRTAKEELNSRLVQLNDKLNRYLASNYGVQLSTSHDAEDENFESWKESHRPFHWFAEFYNIVEHGGGFDVIIGNPPYVRYTTELRKKYTVQNYRTESCGDLYALFMERVKLFATKSTPIGMIIPLPAFSTNGMAPLMDEFIHQQKTLLLSFYAVSPQKLFVGAKQRLVIAISLPGKMEINTTRYLLWHPSYRKHLFDGLQYVTTTRTPEIQTIPKMELDLSKKITEKMKINKLLSNYLSNSQGKGSVFVYNAPENWTRATNFIPYFWNERDGERSSTQIKTFFVSGEGASSLCALINSSLFYWWFIIMSDCRHLNIREIIKFPFNLFTFHKNNEKEVSSLVDKLMSNYLQYATRKTTQYRTTGKVVYDEFHPRHGKSIMDEIDELLAKHYNFTEEELDYIINYDYKYRMGGADE